MKKMFLTLIAAALAGIVLAQPPAKGKGPKGPRGPLGGAPAMDAIVRMVQDPGRAAMLDITPEQSAKLAALGNTDERKAAAGARKKLRDAMEKQAELLKAQPIDEAAVMASIDEVFELRKAGAKEQMKKVIAVRTILTPEQIEKARKLMREMRGKRGEGRGRGPREGRHPSAKDKGAGDKPKANPPPEA